jgi:hypothetical protein
VRLTTLKDCRCIFGVLVVWMRGLYFSLFCNMPKNVP